MKAIILAAGAAAILGMTAQASLGATRHHHYAPRAYSYGMPSYGMPSYGRSGGMYGGTYGQRSYGRSGGMYGQDSYGMSGGMYGQPGSYGMRQPGNYFPYHRGRLGGGKNSSAESAVDY